ncbi:hypothetical protein [Gaoshiqia sediminis]|uniref:Uncharacterized protein n=1 Tax=Gaoshiqia sediminis TaxID=2986998 RepID=A0AA41YEM1_9BACT|nr:hypothetical protein [Gaoshiqia sediminis]MCW0484482.1 hypothetical protein [Gaoshiqia sediminis]
MKTEVENRERSVEYAIVIRMLTVIASIVLVSYTVSAQELWEQLLTHNSFGEIAILMAEEHETALTVSLGELNPEKPTTNLAASFFREPVVDECLELESWMTDDVYFGACNFMFQIEPEPALDIESWMTDEAYFGNPYADEADRELELEAWMTNDSYWTAKQHGN